MKVLFSSDTDILEERRKWQSQNVPVDQWPRLVNRKLMKEANASQAGALRLLASVESDQFKLVSSFYIVNMMILEAKAELIYRLYDLAAVNQIDFANEEWELIEPDVIGEAQQLSVAGKEPGLEAINAPPMWKLGYTGKGRIVYDYDTGVWPGHPAFAERFLGNYAPMDQSWYGYYSPMPTGARADHGTHVLGTISGLNPMTGDTLGVAFGSYWIANDLIGHATVSADLPPLAEMVKGFEWALNPDGDTSTTNDIPDVINNSWRWRDTIDTLHCGGYIVQLMQAIEAAGIANVFSGGNTGPNNVGVNSPQRINSSVVNTFSVGSVNGNVGFPYPISGFSTLGPTQCPGFGSLSIHPEVVAPGQNVRSAWGQDGFNIISGTSMASPHVSGAVLLLKEAFPQLSGDTLLYELYTTAVDLGAAGEDNTYGNGMIDVFAAFQSLSQRHTPVDPTKIAWNLAIEGIDMGTSTNLICDTLSNVTLQIRNLGDSAISQFQYELKANGQVIAPSNTAVLTNPISAGGTLAFNITGVTIPFVSGGDYEIIAVVNLISVTDHDPIDNQYYKRINFRHSIGLPFSEGFEGGIAATRWYRNNEDLSITWDTARVPDAGGQKLAAYINYRDYEPRSNQVDQIWTPQLKLPSTGSISLLFDVAYQEYVPVPQLYDTLKVLVSADCGATTTEVYRKYGQDLNTTGNTGPGFIPQNRNEWRRDSVDLTAFAGQEVLVVFEGVNRNGNDLYLDNISIFEGAQDPLSTQAEEFEQMQVYPIPASGILHVKMSSDLDQLNFRILDLGGKMLQTGILNQDSESSIPIDGLNAGVYLIELSGGLINETHRFIVE